MPKRTGQIKRLKNGKWVARVQWINANRKRQSASQTCASRQEATDALKVLLKDLKTVEAAPVKVYKTFNDLFDNYLEVIRPTIREQTYYLYERIIKSYLRDEFGELTVDSLDTLTLEKFYARLQKKYSAEMIFKIHTQLKCAMRRGRLWKWLDDNPTEYVKPPKRIKKRKETLTPEELNRFFNHCPTNASRAMWTFFALTGARAQEVFAARWQDIDFEKKVFSVEQALIQIKQVKKFDDLKTEHSRRKIPLSDEMVLILKKHKNEQNITRLKYGAAWVDNDLVFPTGTGKPQRLSNIGTKCTKIKTDAGIEKKVTPHIFRHSFISLAVNDGSDIKVVSEIAGHAGVSITLDVYTHTDKHEKENVINEMSRRLLSKC